jgi:hypothetical protein
VCENCVPRPATHPSLQLRTVILHDAAGDARAARTDFVPPVEAVLVEEAVPLAAPAEEVLVTA